jgi:hypothetical protein
VLVEHLPGHQHVTRVVLNEQDFDRPPGAPGIVIEPFLGRPSIQWRR